MTLRINLWGERKNETMKIHDKSIKSIIELVQSLVDNKTLEPEMLEPLKKACSGIDHALATRDIKKIEAEIGKIIRLFLQSNFQ